MLDTKAFRAMSYGVYIVSAAGELDGASRGFGCVVNTVVQVTSKPARISVALNKENATTGTVLKAGRFEASVLAESAPMELIGRFGFHTSTDLDKFAETQHGVDAQGTPYVVEHAVAHLGANVLEAIDAGTHMLILGEVDEAEVLLDEPPMTYAYYHLVKGGKTPPKASSYEQPEAAAETAPEAEAEAESPAAAGEGKRYGWQCSICGYIVEMDELPDDFTCPICGVGKEMFTRVEL